MRRAEQTPAPNARPAVYGIEKDAALLAAAEQR